MDVRGLKNIIEDNSDRLAFIVGNGVNRYRNVTDSADWQKILVDFWNAISSNQIVDRDLDGISLTELYDILSLQTVEMTDARDEFIRKVNTIQHSKYHDQLQEKLIAINRPVLTTNFDSLLEDGLKLHRFKSDLPFTAYYPWESYWSNQELSSPESGFGIWHVNGMTKYKQSIKLGLSQYTQMAGKAKDLLHAKGSAIDVYDGTSGSSWRGMTTWFQIIFGCDLLIFGLGLEKDETFLRWLLFERAKYYDRFNGARRNGWYVCNRGEIKSGKKLFLENIGIEVVELNGFDEIYSVMLGI